MALDADTVPAPDALEKLLPSLDDPRVAAACSFVIPRHVRTVWERGRYVEYLFAFTFLKPIRPPRAICRGIMQADGKRIDRR
ncbi:MAG: glycosyltransferase [Actinobacteria bacterium]|nr:glycosyltransferase [Actinomycetota bacterium]